jgi:hypothetical protein
MGGNGMQHRHPLGSHAQAMRTKHFGNIMNHTFWTVSNS